MSLLIPYKALTEHFPELLKDNRPTSLIQNRMIGLVKMMLSSVAVDDVWYRSQYSDVGKAIDDGIYESAQRHFMDHGYFEGRLPGHLTVDETWYLAAYDDIAIGIEDGEIASAEEHFNQHGYAEGRFPIRPPDL